jgi:hypothetical protein
VPPGKRGSSRRRTEEPCIVTVLGEQPVTATGLIIDVSGTGAALLLSNPIEIETLVSVKYESAILMGEVRNCVHTRAGFRVGLEILGRD